MILYNVSIQCVLSYCVCSLQDMLQKILMDFPTTAIDKHWSHLISLYTCECVRRSDGVLAALAMSRGKTVGSSLPPLQVSCMLAQNVGHMKQAKWFLHHGSGWKCYKLSIQVLLWINCYKSHAIFIDIRCSLGSQSWIQGAWTTSHGSQMTVILLQAVRRHHCALEAKRGPHRHPGLISKWSMHNIA